jgi:hypothetical protein
MYLVDMEAVAHLNCWWADMELSPSADIQQAMIAKNLTPDEEFNAGRATARAAFAGEAALPLFVNRPQYCHPCEHALSVNDGDDDIYGPADESGHRPLKTLRGLGSLLKSP